MSREHSGETVVGRALCPMGLACATAAILLGGLGYYLCLTSGDEVGQTLGVFAAVLNAVSMGVSGLEGPLE